jgi:hypothetical protein
MAEPMDGLFALAGGDQVGDRPQRGSERIRLNSAQQRFHERGGIDRDVRIARECEGDGDRLKFRSLHPERMRVRDLGRSSGHGGDRVEIQAANRAAGVTRIAPPLPNDPSSYSDREASRQVRPFRISSNIAGGPPA